MAPLVGVRKACAVGKTVSQSNHARIASKVGWTPSTEEGSVDTCVEKIKRVRFVQDDEPTHFEYNSVMHHL